VVKGKNLLPWLLLGVFALSRLPGMLPENFSAAYALAFCGGLYLSRRLAWTVPLGVLLGTDLLLNLLYYHHPVLDGYMALKTLAFVGIVALGRLFKPGMAWWKLLGGGLLGALLFYLATNFASWLYDPGYPKTLAGLWQALTTGLPGYPPTWTFFRNTMMSGGLFTALFVGSMKLNEAPESNEEPEASAEEEEAEAPDRAKA
jgi:hypothetical protein